MKIMKLWRVGQKKWTFNQIHVSQVLNTEVFDPMEITKSSSWGALTIGPSTLLKSFLSLQYINRKKCVSPAWHMCLPILYHQFEAMSRDSMVYGVHRLCLTVDPIFVSWSYENFLNLNLKAFMWSNWRVDV